MVRNKSAGRCGIKLREGISPQMSGKGRDYRWSEVTASSSSMIGPTAGHLMKGRSAGSFSSYLCSHNHSLPLPHSSPFLKIKHKVLRGWKMTEPFHRTTSLRLPYENFPINVLLKSKDAIEKKIFGTLRDKIVISCRHLTWAAILWFDKWNFVRETTR